MTLLFVKHSFCFHPRPPPPAPVIDYCPSTRCINVSSLLFPCMQKSTILSLLAPAQPSHPLNNDWSIRAFYCLFSFTLFQFQFVLAFARSRSPRGFLKCNFFFLHSSLHWICSSVAADYFHTSKRFSQSFIYIVNSKVLFNWHTLPTLHLDVESFDCSWLALVLAEDSNKPTARTIKVVFFSVARNSSELPFLQ